MQPYYVIIRLHNVVEDYGSGHDESHIQEGNPGTNWNSFLVDLRVDFLLIDEDLARNHHKERNVEQTSGCFKNYKDYFKHHWCFFLLFHFVRASIKNQFDCEDQ